MSTADVELPVAQGLVRAEGVHDMTMTGLSFQRDRFDDPTDKGWADGQAAVLPNSAMPPGAVQFHGATNVTLDGVSVGQTGASGIEFSSGSNHDTVINSSVWQAGADGIILGDVTSDQVSDSDQVIGTHVSDNGRILPSAVGIMAGYVKNTTIAHDVVMNAPYSGVSLGWGWGGPTQMGNNHIDHNHIEAMTDPNLFDGGDIYVNGVTDATHRSTIDSNWLSSLGSDGAEADPNHRSWDGKAASYSSLYLDGSANNYDVTNNVVANVHQGTWIGLQTVVGQVAKNNVVSHNWTDTASANSGDPADNTVSDNTVFSDSAVPDAVTSIEKAV